MNEQLLKMNGLSVEILDTLSFESHLGIPLKNNLHYFDKDLLIAELVAMTEWLDEQEILSGIALDYRVKSLDSILLKYDRYYPDHQTRKVFNDILGFRAFCDSYDQILEEESVQFRIADMLDHLLHGGVIHTEGLQRIDPLLILAHHAQLHLTFNFICYQSHDVLLLFVRLRPLPACRHFQ
mgnify:CR=1 FL=1